MVNKNIIADLSLMLLYLTSWKEKAGAGKATRSWRSYNWDALDKLKEEGFISGSNKAKSVYLSADGEARAEELLAQYKDYLSNKEADLRLQGVSGAARATVRAFHFRIELDFDVLSCWRELVVPADYSFLDFHIVIQNAFSWLDYHLFDFALKHNGERIKIAEPGSEPIDSIWDGILGVETLREVDASELLLKDIFPKTRTAVYSYDYGDGWEHKIKLLETVGDFEGSDPVCVKGEGDAPPEDVGAEDGFIRFLDAIGNPDNPEHKEMVEWGEGQAFERFDLAKTNEKLKGWRQEKAAREIYRGYFSN